MARRAAVVGISAGILLSLGCSVDVRTGKQPPVPTVSADAATTAKAIELLRAGTEFIDQTSFRGDFEIDQITTLAHTDNVHRRADVTISANGSITEIRVIDNEVYMKTGHLQGIGDEWMTLDPTRVPSDFAVGFAPGKNDPGGSARLINAIVTARADGSQIIGTVDITRIAPGNGISFLPGAGGRFPDSARSQAFRATLDAEGRLVSFSIPAAGGEPNASLRYSDFGTVVEVMRPQGAIAAPDALYPQLSLDPPVSLGFWGAARREDAL